MKPVLIVYATREGHTRRIAEHVGQTFTNRGISVDIVDAADPWQGLALDAHSAVIAAASVHGGKHEPEMVRFVKTHREELDAIPSALLSVSLSEAGAENLDSPAENQEMRCRRSPYDTAVLRGYWLACGTGLCSCWRADVYAIQLFDPFRDETHCPKSRGFNRHITKS